MCCHVQGLRVGVRRKGHRACLAFVRPLAWTAPVCGAESAFWFASYLRRSAVLRFLGGVQHIFSMLGGLLGLSVASRKLAWAPHPLRPPPSIYLVGPAAAGKTTLLRYLCHSPRPEESASTLRWRRTGRLAAAFSESRRSWFRSRITDDGLGQQ